MRLTLRTLLACRDHVLSPAEQGELDAKLAGSTAAQQLAGRIGRVIGQPTIPAPRLDGRGLAADANSVAEYLDNCLDPNRLETFERICLESDMHLAEVAACHEILATIARDPAAIATLDAAGRRKLLAAMGHLAAGVGEENERGEARRNARVVRQAIGATEDAGRPVGSRRRPSGVAAWVAAITALTLVVALGMLLAEAIGRGRGRHRGGDGPREVALDARPAVVQPAIVDTDRPVPEPPLETAPAPAAVEPDEAAVVPSAVPPGVPDVERVAEPRAESVDAPSTPPPAPPADAETPASPALPAPAPATASGATTPPAGAVGEAPRVPQGDALAIAAPVPVRPSSNGLGGAIPSESIAKPETAATGQEALGFVDAGGLLVHRVIAEGTPPWQALAPGAALGVREDLVAPYGAQPTLHVRGVTIRLFPATRAVISADADGTPRLEVVFGRAIVRASRPDSRVGITAGGLVGAITAGLAGPAAVSVDLDHVPGADPALDTPRVRAGLLAINGGIVWRQAAAADGAGALQGIGAEGMLDARTGIVWENTAPGTARITRLDALPAWAARGEPLDRLQRNAGEALAARVAETGALGQALRELAADRRVENRIVAAATLALLGEFDAAVELLCDETANGRLAQGQWSKLEGDVVPLALARGANAAAKLRRAFEDHGPPAKAEALFAMARGFTDEELAGGAAETLVDALDDGDLVVRRYAYKCLCDIVQPTSADRLRYRPDGLPELRRDGAAWWRGQLQKGLIRRPGAA